MALYPENGDEGFSRLPGHEGGPVRKDDARFTALGTIDELNVSIGLCLAEARRAEGDEICRVLSTVQQELLSLGATLAAGGAGGDAPAQLEPDAVRRMQEQIDRTCGKLPELKHFILPGGCELAGRLHLACAVCRRAERAVVAALNPPRPGLSDLLVQYLNRLSDLLFALARQANHDAGVPDAIWKP